MRTPTWSPSRAATALDVKQQDLLEALGESEPGSLGAVTALQVAEHLPPAVLVRFLELAAAALRPAACSWRRRSTRVAGGAAPLLRRPDARAAASCPRRSSCWRAGPGSRSGRDHAYLNEPPPHEDRRISDALFAPLDYALVARK